VPPEVKEDYLPFSWSDSKWAHLVHCEEIFDSELEFLTSLWQAILGSRCSMTIHAARQRFTLLGEGSRCSAMAHNCSTTHYGDRTLSLTAWLRSHLLGQAQDGIAQRIQGAQGLAVGVRPRIPTADHMGCAPRGGPAHKMKPICIDA